MAITTVFPYTTLFRSALALALCAAPAAALDFRSVADNAAILYDGPTSKSSKLFVVNKGYPLEVVVTVEDRKSTRLNSSHSQISYAVFFLKKKIKVNKN